MLRTILHSYTEILSMERLRYFNLDKVIFHHDNALIYKTNFV